MHLVETFEELMANVYCMVAIVWIWLADELSVARQSIYASLAYFFEKDHSIQFTHVV